MKSTRKASRSWNAIKEQLKKEYDIVVSRLKTLEQEDPFSHEADFRGDSDEIATRTASHDRITALRFELTRHRDQIQKALQKIQRGLYGTCESCKKPIPRARLKAFLTARYCVKCQGKGR